MKESASYIINKAEKEGCNRFDNFAQDIYKVFEEILSDLSMPDTKSFKEKLWSYFHGVRFKMLPGLWCSLYSSLDAPEKYKKDPLSMQYCSTKLFEIAVKSKYPATTTIEYTAEDTPSLTEDEENGLQYVAGYVVHSLIRKTQKLPDSNSKKPNILACLKEINNEEGNYKDYLSYTKAWLEKVNRLRRFVSCK